MDWSNLILVLNFRKQLFVETLFERQSFSFLYSTVYEHPSSTFQHLKLALTHRGVKYSRYNFPPDPRKSAFFGKNSKMAAQRSTK